MHKVILSIEGMSCSACSNAIEKYLNKQSGIVSASVNLVLSQALIEYNDSLTIVKIEGMHCEHCAMKVVKALEGKEGIAKDKGNLKDKEAIIRRKEELNKEMVKDTITDLGYEVIKIK